MLSSSRDSNWEILAQRTHAIRHRLAQLNSLGPETANAGPKPLLSQVGGADDALLLSDYLASDQPTMRSMAQAAGMQAAGMTQAYPAMMSGGQMMGGQMMPVAGPSSVPYYDMGPGSRPSTGGSYDSSAAAASMAGLNLGYSADEPKLQQARQQLSVAKFSLETARAGHKLAEDTLRDARITTPAQNAGMLVGPRDQVRDAAAIVKLAKGTVRSAEDEVRRLVQQNRNAQKLAMAAAAPPPGIVQYSPATLFSNVPMPLQQPAPIPQTCMTCGTTTCAGAFGGWCDNAAYLPRSSVSSFSSDTSAAQLEWPSWASSPGTESLTSRLSSTCSPIGSGEHTPAMMHTYGPHQPLAIPQLPTAWVSQRRDPPSLQHSQMQHSLSHSSLSTHNG